VGRLKYRLRSSRVSCRELPPASPNKGFISQKMRINDDDEEGAARAGSNARLLLKPR
jgi:hypothetical protein